MAKFPSIQFYPGDWRKDPAVQALTYEERGIWIEILFLMHESDERGKLMVGGKAITDERLANILHLDKQKITTTITSLLELGVASRCDETGALMSRRMVRDSATLKKRAECGKMGGNPQFKEGQANPYYQKDNQKDNHPHNQIDKQTDNQKITPSSSSSSSEVINTPKFKKPSIEECKLQAAKMGLPESEGERFWHYYESNGWKIGGKTPMKSYQSAMVTWRGNWQEKSGRFQPAKTSTTDIDAEIAKSLQ